MVELVVKNLPANAGDKRCGFIPWVGKIPWRRTWPPSSVFLPGESHGRGAWWATVHRVAKSQTRLKQLGIKENEVNILTIKFLYKII